MSVGELIMLKRHSMSRLLTLFVPVALLTGCAEPALHHQPLVVFLVRHAEKVDASDKSELSAAGNERSAALATILRDADIDYVHSTDFTRTRKTASPIAAECGVEVDLYEVGDLPDLAKQLQRNGGRHLVVGHSNTTPRLVELLGGEPGTEIQEDEYDRLYIVMIGRDGVASTVLMRYGDAFVRAQSE
jgi:probable phosphoglycerate mutase